MQQELKFLLDDKANMTRLCEKINVKIVPSMIFEDIEDIKILHDEVCVKNARGCCGVFTFVGSRDNAERWLQRQKRRNLPSGKWVVQPSLGVSLDEIRIVYSVF